MKTAVLIYGTSRFAVESRAKSIISSAKRLGISSVGPISYKSIGSDKLRRKIEHREGRPKALRNLKSTNDPTDVYLNFGGKDIIESGQNSVLYSNLVIFSQFPDFLKNQHQKVKSDARIAVKTGVPEKEAEEGQQPFSYDPNKDYKTE